MSETDEILDEAIRFHRRRDQAAGLSPVTVLAAAAAGDAPPCDAHGCHRRAVEVLRFRDQPGHVHVCGPCGALDREWCDVAESRPLPCPWVHTGHVWVDQPRELAP